MRTSLSQSIASKFPIGTRVPTIQIPPYSKRPVPAAPAPGRKLCWPPTRRSPRRASERVYLAVPFRFYPNSLNEYPALLSGDDSIIPSGDQCPTQGYGIICMMTIAPQKESVHQSDKKPKSNEDGQRVVDHLSKKDIGVAAIENPDKLEAAFFY